MTEYPATQPDQKVLKHVEAFFFFFPPQFLENSPSCCFPVKQVCLSEFACICKVKGRCRWWDVEMLVKPDATKVETGRRFLISSSDSWREHLRVSDPPAAEKVALEVTENY